MGCGARSWTSRSISTRQPPTDETTTWIRRTVVGLTVATTGHSLLSRTAFAQTTPKAKNAAPANAGVTTMSISALLLVDPYNDFISEGGKLWPRIKAVADANGCVSNMLKVLNAARAAKLRVFYAMHHRYRSGDYETWTYIAPVQRGAWQHKTFEYGTWG